MAPGMLSFFPVASAALRNHGAHCIPLTNWVDCSRNRLPFWLLVVLFQLPTVLRRRSCSSAWHLAWYGRVDVARRV